jgi:hypothetical protein
VRRMPGHGLSPTREVPSMTASSEDYTIVWVGVAHALVSPDEVEAVASGAHPLAAAAHRVGMETFVDSFAFDAAGEPQYTLLAGSRLALMGFKEGLTSLEVPEDRLWALLAGIREQCRDAGFAERPTLHVLLHIGF